MERINNTVHPRVRISKPDWDIIKTDARECGLFIDAYIGKVLSEQAKKIKEEKSENK